MNDSSEERRFVSQTKIKRKLPPTYENLDRARMDQVIPEPMLSARSSKRVRFDNNDWHKKLKRDSDSGQEAPMQRASKQKSKPKKMDISNNDSAENQFLQVSNSGQFNEFTEQFYPKKGRSSANTGIRNKAFEPQFLSSNQTLSWQARATKEGFLYFLIPGTNTFQWQFPTYFDAKSQKKKNCFLENWTAKTDETGHTYYLNKVSKFTQEVKPDSETYILQAAMLGNIAFTELYINVQGDLGIEDARGRNALHQSVSNGHHQLTQIICEFGKVDNLIERSDKNGCTPLFTAIRYNQANCVQLLLQYNCNIFHRNKKGDTCLHYAAIYNAVDCLSALGTFCSEQLIKTRNKEGLRAVEVAQQMKHFACQNALHLLERNIVFQNALLLRDQGMPSNQIRKVTNAPASARSALSNKMGAEPLRNPNVKKFEEDGSSTELSAREASQNLQYDQHYQRAYTDRDKMQRAQRHEIEYREKNKRDLNTERMAQTRIPRFVRKNDHIPPSHRATFQNSQIQDSYFDEEINGRVSRSARQRIRSDKYDLYQKKTDQSSVFEKAYFGLTKVGSFFKNQVSSIVDYVYSDAKRPSRSRSRKMVLNTDDDGLPMPRGVSARNNYQDSDNFNSARDDFESSSHVEQNVSSGSENYKTTYDRSQSRPATAKSRSRTRQQFSEITEPLPRSARVTSNALIQSPARTLKDSRPPQIIQEKTRDSKFVNKETEVSQERSVEMRSICIQAMPPKRVKKHKRQDVSKHSIGVGSMRIDETTMPLQDQTGIEDQSENKGNKLKKQQKIKLGNQNRNLIQKRYQSEEDDRQLMEDSKNFSPSPQPKFMKPELIVMRSVEKLGQAFTKDVPQAKPVPSRAKQTNQSDQLTLSYTSSTRAPNLLTEAQKNILNLQGQVQNNPNSDYKIEVDVPIVQPTVFEMQVEKETKSKPVDEQIKDFYARLASEMSSESLLEGGPPSSVQVQDFHFLPEEQDEENYQFHIENFNHYENSSQDSVLDELEKENFEVLSDPSFVPNQSLFKFGQRSAASVDRCRLIQSTSTHSIANFSVQNSMVLKPAKILTNYPQSDCEGTARPKRFIVPLPKKKEAIKPPDLFSEESEKKRLRGLSQNGSEAVSVKSKRPDEELVFFGIDSPKSSLSAENQEENSKVEVPKLLLTSQERASSKGGQNRYESVVEDEFINFDITQEISQAQPHIEVEVAQNTTPAESLAIVGMTPQSKEIEIRKTQNLQLQQQQADEVLMAQVLDDIGEISSLFDGLKEESTVILEQKSAPVKVQQRSSSVEEEIKQNRSTAAVQYKANNFMMSSDEDRRPTDGQKSARSKKSVKEVNLKSKQASANQSIVSEQSPNNVTERLRQSMAQFKNNKLGIDKDKNRSVLTNASRKSELNTEKAEEAKKMTSSKIGMGSKQVQ